MRRQPSNIGTNSKRHIVLVLVLICAGTIGWTIWMGSGTPDATMPTKQRPSVAWPRAPELDEYSKALKMLESGRGQAAVCILDRLSRSPIRIAPDSAWDDDLSLYYGPFLSRRFRPAIGMLAKVFHANALYAKELDDQKGRVQVLHALSVNTRIARQMVHIQPADDPEGLIRGNGLWRDAWTSIADVLSDNKQHAEASRARDCAARADRFLSGRIKPWFRKSESRMEVLQRRLRWMPGAMRKREENTSVLKKVRAEAREIRKLIEDWDKQVDGKDCDRLLNDIAASGRPR